MAPDSTRFGDGKLPVGKAGYDENNGCIVPDIRNVDSDYKDNLILFGGGWNMQPTDPGVKRVRLPSFQLGCPCNFLAKKFHF